MPGRELGLRNQMELLSYKPSPFKNPSSSIYFLYWFQGALATIRVHFWHECVSWERCLFFFNTGCIVGKQWSKQAWLTHCNGLALFSWHCCLDIVNQRCCHSRERRTLLSPPFLSKVENQTWESRMMLGGVGDIIQYERNHFFISCYFKWRLKLRLELKKKKLKKVTMWEVISLLIEIRLDE